MMADALPLSAVAELLRQDAQLAERRVHLAERMLAAIERQQAPAGPPKAALTSFRLIPREKRILAALGADAMTGEALAAKVGVEFAGSFRDLLAIMTAHGVLSNDDDGYARGPNAA